MVFHELSLYWTRGCNFFAGRRMRHLSAHICERGPHVACTNWNANSESRVKQAALVILATLDPR
jgi:hypothetical protein